MRKKFAAGAVGVLAAGVMLVAIPQASAVDPVVTYTDDGRPHGGKSVFYERGDKLIVEDVQAGDGYHAWGAVYTRDGGHRYGKAEGYRGKVGRNNMNIPEGKKIKVRICLQRGNSGTLKWCDWENATA